MEEVKENVPQEGDFKIKKKPKKFTNKIVKNTKIDLSKKETDAISKSEPVLVDENKQTGNVQEMDGGESNTEMPSNIQEKSEEKQNENRTEITSPIVEITDEPVKEEITEPVINTPVAPQLPENVEKLVNFMQDTGGTVEDYVRLNADYSNADDVTLLKEFYKTSKPHLNNDEIEFMLNDQFSYNEEEDDEKTVRKRKLAIKEEVVKAKGFLEDLKSKYYEEIKLRPGATQEQQKATDFFNRYNTEQEKVKKTRSEFINKTNTFFKDDFKGFDFNLGEKKVRYNVNNPDEVATTQSDISNFFEMFLDENGAVKDYNKYHKSLFAARNIDSIATHFYEQGKADAVKSEYAKSKNITNKPRVQQMDDSIYLNGMKIKAVSGLNTSKLKIKRKK